MEPFPRTFRTENKMGRNVQETGGDFLVQWPHYCNDSFKRIRINVNSVEWRGKWNCGLQPPSFFFFKFNHFNFNDFSLFLSVAGDFLTVSISLRLNFIEKIL